LKESIFVTSFDHLGLADSLLRAVRAEGYHTATPIQIQAIPPVLAGRDLMGCAQTGTGKTAAFALPTLHRLSDNGSDGHNDNPTPRKRNRRPIRSLVLAPTRELAAQIGESFATYGKFMGLQYTVVYGGVGQGPQVRALANGVDVLIATPGRLLDLMEQGYIDLRNVQILILDEADQMLDMGFIVPLRRIVSAVPKARQTLMFSATMPAEIRKLAAEWLRNPVQVQVGPVATPIEAVEQSVYFVEPRHKPQLLAHFLQNTAYTRTLVFARTKHGADKIVKKLMQSGIRALAIHGNKSQSVRQRTLDAFKSTRPPVLVATDVAARGLDIDGISHVVNYDLPNVPEMYVHRIGRTGRAGAAGVATSFCGREERGQLRDIERLTRQKLAIEQNQPEYQNVTTPAINVGGNAARPIGTQPRGPHGSGRSERSGATKSRRPALTIHGSHRPSGYGSGRTGGSRRRSSGARRRPQ
jgi:ATP-dependent RNA helicase RhlE